MAGYMKKGEAAMRVYDCVVCGKTRRTWHKHAEYCSSKCRNNAQERERSPLSTARTGAVTELRVCIDLMEKHFEVFRNVAPVGVDLMAYRDGQAIRVAVRTATRHPRTAKWYFSRAGFDSADIAALVVRDEIRYIEPKTCAPIAL